MVFLLVETKEVLLAKKVDVQMVVLLLADVQMVEVPTVGCQWVDV